MEIPYLELKVKRPGSLAAGPFVLISIIAGGQEMVRQLS